MKRASLAANVKAAAGDAGTAPVASPADPVKQMRTAANEQAEAGKRSPGRAGRKAIYAWVEPAEHKKLKLLSLETGRSIDALVAEGVALLFARHGVIVGGSI